MSLPFFKALNPTSTESGINYTLAKLTYFEPLRRRFAPDGMFDHMDVKDERCYKTRVYPCQHKEMIDITLSEAIKKAIHTDLNIIEGIIATFHIIVGSHYDMQLVGRNDCKGGAKGILDFLILPLLARKLFADTFEPDQTNTLFNILAWTIALPIEVARLSAGLALTALLVPVIALVHAIKALMPEPANDSPPAGLIEQIGSHGATEMIMTK